MRVGFFGWASLALSVLGGAFGHGMVLPTSESSISQEASDDTSHSFNQKECFDHPKPVVLIPQSIEHVTIRPVHEWTDADVKRIQDFIETLFIRFNTEVFVLDVKTQTVCIDIHYWSIFAKWLSGPGRENCQKLLQCYVRYALRHCQYRIEGMELKELETSLGIQDPLNENGLLLDPVGDIKCPELNITFEDCNDELGSWDTLSDMSEWDPSEQIVVMQVEDENPPIKRSHSATGIQLHLKKSLSALGGFFLKTLPHAKKPYERKGSLPVLGQSG